MHQQGVAEEASGVAGQRRQLPADYVLIRFSESRAVRRTDIGTGKEGVGVGVGCDERPTAQGVPRDSLSLSVSIPLSVERALMRKITRNKRRTGSTIIQNGYYNGPTALSLIKLSSI